ncbi:MAG TPA: Pr6Pr family membrane protein [Puia sp.]|nr:Pr6Pr family membrane protein [Puia sp.]
MEKKPSKMQLLCMLFIAVIAWAGVVLQFYIVTGNWAGLGLSPIEGTIRFSSYFTILTNIIVALSLTIALLKPQTRFGIFFRSNSNQTAIAMYIFVVGLVYNLILRKLWAPEGLQLIVDNILHSIVPLLYVIYWLVYIPKQKMQWSKAVSWLLYPALYFAWVLIFGFITRFYPYPFIDVNVLGYPKMFMHAGILLIVFLILGFAAIAIKKVAGKNTKG